MKNSVKILTGAAIAISFATGLLIGISINNQSPKKNNLSGTIGKANNHFNIKIEDNDTQLRSKLISDESLLQSYRQTFTYHYNSSVKLCSDIDFAITAAENASSFSKEYSTVIENLKKYRQKLEKSKENLLLAVTTLQDLTKSDENTIAEIITNANNELPDINYKQTEILAFVDSVEKFILGNNPYLYPELITSHDRLSVNQLIVASTSSYFQTKSFIYNS